MWPCERSPVRLVLNGADPDVRRMSLPGLERLVARLVQRSGGGVLRPKWWPRGLEFRQPLGLRDERAERLALRQLVGRCSQFFRGGNDENRRRGPRPASKSQFLRCLRLGPRRAKAEAPPPPPAPPPKLANCVHIPFSSDVGRLMAAREQHRMSEDLKLKRLERSEWYTNRAAPRVGDVEYETGVYREPGHVHTYKLPKRQHHHKHQSMRNADFLARFCTPLCVSLDRMDLDKVKSERDRSARRRLVVRIDKEEKRCCDAKCDKILRTSPRLRNVLLV